MIFFRCVIVMMKIQHRQNKQHNHYLSIIFRSE